MRKMIGAVVFLLSLSLLAVGQSTLVSSQTTWNGIARYYAVYVPASLPAEPALVFCLHATVTDSTGTNPPTNWCQQHGWQTNADRFGYLLVTPASSWNAATGQWFWDAFNLDPLFSPLPDDSGFLRNLIQTLSAQYNADPARVFVYGASSGGFMAHRVGIDSSDLVAAIAPASGMLWADSSTVPSITSPVSVLQCEGQVDTTVPDCGGSKPLWTKTKIAFAGIDATINYWLQQDGLPPNPQPLCTGGSLTPGVVSYRSVGPGGVEVNYQLELGVGHGCDASWPETVSVFFAGHPKASK